MNVMLSSPPATDEPVTGGKAEANQSTLSIERPFPGLRPFVFTDRAFFFGRESQAFALYRLVENGGFVAVVGGSGSGKSSLVLAGLCGLLDEETRDTYGPKWVCLDTQPRGAPIKRLAAALARLSPRESAKDSDRLAARIEYRLRQSSFSLQSALQEAGGLGGRHLLLIVDQFEELFRFGLSGLGRRHAGLAEAKARDEATLFVQILLDADRRRLPNVHVLVTMRSDFIGDCAYFSCLPEAVSRTQYLVPNLNRTQLEEVIRCPIEKAGGTIEPELLERLLNDCGDELDQLPVLQHCLMRLWDRAGAAAAGGMRSLARQTYDDIGRMTDALSRHADEVLRECGGDLAVEQAFRALSELDREGRAIRRACRFDRLLEETGVAETNLRDVLDRFRAPTCSFLVPPPNATATLKDDDVVDIGHESLLRRWRKLSGDTPSQEPTAARTALGWLADEQADGQRYRTLVSLLDGEKASLTAPEKTKHWWDSRPRTTAWADRYGGRFEDVKRLIRHNIVAKTTRRIALLVLAFAVLGGIGWFAHMQVEDAQLREEAIDRGAMKSAKTLLEHVVQAYNKHSLDLAGARSLATVSEQFLDDIRASRQSSAADSLWAEALDDEADLQTTSGNYEDALVLTTKAQEAAARDAVLHSNPADPHASDSLRLLYATTIRSGSALAAPTIVRFDDALTNYRSAVTIAEKVISISDDEPAEADLVDAHIKIGDIYRIRTHYLDAIQEYRSGLAVCDAALMKFPDHPDLRRNRGKAFFRIAETLRLEGLLDEAREAYQAALELQEPLARDNPNNADLKSNLAATYSHWGALEKKAGNLDLARSKYERAVALDEDLIQIDLSNPQWESYAVPNFAVLAEILNALNRPKEALVYYQKTYDTSRDLAIRALGNPDLQKQFANAAKSLGDHSEGLDQIVAYRSATRTWKRLLDGPNSANEAAKHFDDVIGFARAFDAARDWPDAQTAYDVAQMIALRNFGKDSSDTSWKDKAAEAAAGAATAATSAVAPKP
jgi:tetratricopeptide (TPR) repeat protein/energy-coupling factor transporter ATP-binding protein EcfA2